MFSCVDSTHLCTAIVVKERLTEDTHGILIVVRFPGVLVEVQLRLGVVLVIKELSHAGYNARADSTFSSFPGRLCLVARRAILLLKYFDTFTKVMNICPVARNSLKSITSPF